MPSGYDGQFGKYYSPSLAESRSGFQLLFSIINGASFAWRRNELRCGDPQISRLMSEPLFPGSRRRPIRANSVRCNWWPGPRQRRTSQIDLLGRLITRDSTARKGGPTMPQPRSERRLQSLGLRQGAWTLEFRDSACHLSNCSSSSSLYADRSAENRGGCIVHSQCHFRTVV